MRKTEPNFETFDPKAYLNTYYQKIGSENDALLSFYSHIYDELEKNSIMLEFSGGPTLYPLISASKKVAEIHFSDYLESNLTEVQKWLKKSSDAFDWSIYIKRALECEGAKNVMPYDIEERSKLMRKKITRIFKCDAFSLNPLGSPIVNKYDVLNLSFVAESITRTRKDWVSIMSNILTLIKRNGTLTMTSLLEAHYYKVGNKLFPAVVIDERDITEFLISRGFNRANIKQTTIKSEVDKDSHDEFAGYTGMVFTLARWA